MQKHLCAILVSALLVGGCGNRAGSMPAAPAVGGSGGTGGMNQAGSGGAPAIDSAAPVDSAGPAPAVDGAAMPDVATTPDAAVTPGAPPLLAILDQFTAADVPAVGPMEPAVLPRPWPVPTVMPMLPGMGLAQHPMLYAGEGYNAVFVVNGGKVAWMYTLGTPGEVDDLWMMSNGHVLVCFDLTVLEISPKKDVVWHYTPPPPAQVHTCQPIGLDRVLIMQNDTPPKVIIVNKQTGMMELDKPLPTPGGVDAGAIHTQFRRFRLTAAGTYLASWLTLNKVVEYDKDFNPIWTYSINTPWSAIRLKNGNTLITDESERTVREVSPKSETVWQWTQADLPAGLIQQNTQSAERLENGDTVIFASRSPTSAAKPNVQAIEVTQDKKVVWVLEDWKDLGQATTAQFLDQPGIPENPGDLQH